MKNCLHLLIFICIICLSLTNSISPVKADSGITIVDNSVDIHFPGAIVFKIQANSNSDITEIRLNYVVKRMNYAKVISEAWPSFITSTSVNTQWIWDMRYSLLPPGTEIQYWWSVENKNGDNIKTDTKTVVFNDNTLSWKKITSGNISILWYKGNDNFADKLMDSALEALDKLEEDTGAVLEEPIEIYVYASLDDLRQAMLFPQEWTGGVAAYEFWKIFIKVDPNDLEWDIDALAHELGHMVVHQITFSSYGIILPLWLDEGLAMHAEMSEDSYYEWILESAYNKNFLISLRTLCNQFSAISELAYLSYAESESVVEYLIQEDGKDKILDLLIKFKEGNTYDDALQQVYGFNMEELESRWINSLKTTFSEDKQSTHEENILNQAAYSLITDSAIMSILELSAL